MNRKYFRAIVGLIVLVLLGVYIVSYVLFHSTLKKHEGEQVSKVASYIADTIDVKQIDDNESTDIITNFTVHNTPDTVVIDGTEYSLTTIKLVVKKNGDIYKEVSKKANKGVYCVVVNIPHENEAEYIVGIELEYTSKDSTQTRYFYKEYIPQKEI